MDTYWGNDPRALWWEERLRAPLVPGALGWEHAL